MPDGSRPKVVGVGLNKTATKSLRTLLQSWGFTPCLEYEAAFRAVRAGDLESVFEIMERYDSFEDWPWPLIVAEIDARFPDARFVLTTRRTAEEWYRSLCRMAIRIGPLDEYEKHIYGSSMPQGRRQHHLDYYRRHNDAVRRHFGDRPGKLLELCIADEDSTDLLASFLGIEPTGEPFPVRNVGSAEVYGGDNLARAHLSRIRFQTAKRLRERRARHQRPGR